MALADWQFLVDPYPNLTLATPTGGTVRISRPAGLYSPGPGGDPLLARPKQFLVGFSLPFDPLRMDRAFVRIWALLSHPRATVLLQRLGHRGAWRTIATLSAARDGVLNVALELQGRATLRVLSEGRASASAQISARKSKL